MKLHLGSGPIRLDEWINIDLDSPAADVLMDLRKPLPYADRSIDYVFAEHFIEHISRPEAVALLKECRRVLNPTGVIRLSTPDIQHIIDAYTRNDVGRWGNLWQPRNRCHLLNEAFYNWGHRFLYDADELRLLLSEAGFSDIQFVPWRESSFAALNNIECRPFNHELIIEASGEAAS
ncbi:class I SAM-dependent methyltransferase [Aureimonas frigidaquae]|uniref:Methyltransferase type 11 domain-containing protein n=1 Tax=Aureimonas frigidaquae TaxID=424757 RepID=A0A0N7KXV8_9HYPH|nr:methyltransferase domain-containing protein [Aureimonas frigidaquae]BAT28001.1 hypothetical protein [Aureimonas frigidaquae]